MAEALTERDRKVLTVDHHQIGNKRKRSQIYQKQKHVKNLLRTQERVRRRENPDAAPATKKRTLENTRVADETVVAADDEEVLEEDQFDEFCEVFRGEKPTKIAITTTYKPGKRVFEFIRDLLTVFPNSFFFKRKDFTLQTIVSQAIERDFTSVLVVHDDNKKINSLMQIALPYGPTAYWKLTNVELSSEIPGHGRCTKHVPEVVMNHFTTRLGFRCGRMLGSLFPPAPDHLGRQVVTLHNQRDFVFFRRHRYIFADLANPDRERADIQELGPRFTLKLRWLQVGTFDKKFGEYEWMRSTDLYKDRKRFFL